MSSPPTSAKAHAPTATPPWATEAFAAPSQTLQIIIVIFLSILGIFILLNLPASIARLSSGKSAFLSSGYVFSRKSKKISPVRAYASGLAVRGAGGGRYLREWMSIIPGAEYLGWEVFGGRYTLGQIFIVLGYLGIVGSALALSKPLVNIPTVGEIATYQIPVAVLFAMKSTPLSPLLGVAYGKLNFLHRWIGRTIWATSTVHGGLFLHKWLKAGTVAKSAKVPFITAGIAAWGAFTLMAMTSIPPIRKRMFGFFKICHWLGFFTAMIALGFHVPKSAFHAIIASSIFLLSHILRLFKLRYTTATLTPLPNANSVVITIPSLKSGWRAGQHVFIRVPGMASLGGMGWVESHPFSIACSQGGIAGEGVVLVVKKKGGWTRGLYDYAMDGDGKAVWSGEMGKEGVEMNEFERGGERRLGRECRIIVDGPYGGPGPMMHNAYPSIMLFAGGSGISYAMGVLEDVLHQSASGLARTSSITLIWSVKTYDEAQPLLHNLHHLNYLSQPLPLNLQIQIHLTRTSPHFPETNDQGILVSPRRPALASAVDFEVAKAKAGVMSGSEGSGCGVFIGVCGPRGLGLGVKSAVRGIGYRDKSMVGGVVVHCESFGL